MGFSYSSRGYGKGLLQKPLLHLSYEQSPQHPRCSHAPPPLPCIHQCSSTHTPGSPIPSPEQVSSLSRAPVIPQPWQIVLQDPPARWQHSEMPLCGESSITFHSPGPFLRVNVSQGLTCALSAEAGSNLPSQATCSLTRLVTGVVGSSSSCLGHKRAHQNCLSSPPLVKAA